MIKLFILSALAAFAMGLDHRRMPSFYIPVERVDPNSNILYNFEQLRKDQPPHIEQREERVGQYMYRRPITTTTSTIAPIHVKDEVFNHYPGVVQNALYSGMRNPAENTNSLPTHGYEIPSSSPVPFSSSTPVYERFPHWHVESNLDINNQQHQQYVPEPILAPEVHQMQEHLENHAMNSAQPQMVPSQSMVRMMPETTVAPINAYVQKVQPHGVPQRHQSTHTNRGNHKFNWDEAVPHEYHEPISAAVSSTTQASATRGPLPPVPTLTPWYDGF